MMSEMKIFSVEEADALIPRVRPLLEVIQKSYSELLANREAAEKAAKGAELGGGGMPGSGRYVELLDRLADATTNLASHGIQLKDYGRGLIDFPSLRDGKVVLLCWQLGEPEKVEWWHDVDAGFAGRKPL